MKNMEIKDGDEVAFDFIRMNKKLELRLMLICFLAVTIAVAMLMLQSHLSTTQIVVTTCVYTISAGGVVFLFIKTLNRNAREKEERIKEIIAKRMSDNKSQPTAFHRWLFKIGNGDRNEIKNLIKSEMVENQNQMCFELMALIGEDKFTENSFEKAADYIVKICS